MTKDDIEAAVYLPQPAIEIGLLHYPGAQQAAILGLTDLFVVANRIAAAYRESADPVVSISHWQQPAVDLPPVRVFDSGAGSPSALPAVLSAVVLPPALAEPVESPSASVLRTG